MQLAPIDWAVIAAFLALYLAIGIGVAKRAGASSTDFFLSGRNMPWWLLGISMVATTFSTDTPNLVTDLVRANGVSGNWVWWAFLLTGMLTCFLYARLWRRSDVRTDVEFYELRYSGQGAAFLRGFRAIYLGAVFNVLVMASVNLAAIKIAHVMVGLEPWQTLLIAGSVTVLYSMLGGLTGVLITDLVQFGFAMIGALCAAYFALGHESVGGLSGLLTHPNVQGKLSILPDFSNTDLVISVLVIPLAVQWWSVYYPGAEPGGGGYLAQRMLAAKNEKHAQGATLLFNIAHYAIRPWPWILVALASLVVFPISGDDGLAELRRAFPDLPEDKLGHDIAYPAMLTFVPAGLLGIVFGSLIAAFMSTTSTQLNLGASYLVNDLYRRFVNRDASERQLVRMGRIYTVLLMLLACAVSLLLENAVKSFDIILQIGAGTGLLFILRWFWWRINPASEITAMLVSFAVAVAFFVHDKLGYAPIPGHLKLLLGVGVTTAAWVSVALLTAPTKEATLRAFCQKIQPGGPGWRVVMERAAADGEPLPTTDAPNIPRALLLLVLGTFGVYGALFATGFYLYGNTMPAVVLTVVAGAASFGVLKLWR